MNQFKRAQVIMLPTGFLARRSEIGLQAYKKNLKIIGHSEDNEIIYNQQHLYIISDDEIKEGDWCIEGNKHPNLFQVKEFNSVTGIVREINGKPYILDACRKIIATTNTSLTIKHKYSSYLRDWNLPQPSQQFIEKYIQAYHKGEVITDILVEYEFNDFKFMSTLCTTKEKEYNLKVNPKDNNITIKKLKDTFSIEDMKSAFNAGMNCPIAGATFKEWFNKIL